MKKENEYLGNRIDKNLIERKYNGNYFHEYWKSKILSIIDIETYKRLESEEWSNVIIKLELGISQSEFLMPNHHTFDKVSNYLKIKKNYEITEENKVTPMIIKPFCDEEIILESSEEILKKYLDFLERKTNESKEEYSPKIRH